MFDWLVKRILRSKAVDAKLDEVSLKVQASMKDSILDLLEDEEVGQAVTDYGDALYDRYTKKFWGTIGGKQRGINSAMEGALSGGFGDILDEDGNPNLSSLIKLFLSGNINLGLDSTEKTTTLKRKEYKYRY